MGELVLTAEPQRVIEPLAADLRRDLESFFRKIRRAGPAFDRLGELAELIDRVFANDEAVRGDVLAGTMGR
jgi:hypothetical protein